MIKKERVRRHVPSLPLTPDRFDYKKTPLSASELYCALRSHVRKSFSEEVRFYPTIIPSERMLAVSEFPFVFTFASLLYLMTKHRNDESVHVNYFENESCMRLSVTVASHDIDALYSILTEKHDALLDIAEPSHFSVQMEKNVNEVKCHLTAPFYNADTFEVHATAGEILSLVTRAFKEARIYTM